MQGGEWRNAAIYKGYRALPFVVKCRGGGCDPRWVGTIVVRMSECVVR